MKKVLQFDLSNLKGDFFGGLTAGVVALPLALAFGEQTELGAIAGLYGAIAIGVLAAFFGGTPTQISGPTAPMTVVSALIIADAIDYAGSLEIAIPIILATFFIAGLHTLLWFPKSLEWRRKLKKMHDDEANSNEESSEPDNTKIDEDKE